MPSRGGVSRVQARLRVPALWPPAPISVSQSVLPAAGRHSREPDARFRAMKTGEGRLQDLRQNHV